MRILVYGNLHHKNHAGMNLINKEIPVIFLQNLNNLHNYDDGNTILIVGDQIKDDINFSKIIFGPNIDFRDVVKYCKNNPTKKININMLSEWNQKLASKFCPYSKDNFITIPFPVDIDKFQPDIKTDKIFIYFKDVEEYKLNLAINLIKDLNIEYKIFKYGSYNENDYLQYIKNCKFGIWVGRHESQGFAVQEALSCNCPLFILDVISMKDEYCYGNYPWKNTELSYDNLDATVASYWNNECGLVCKNLELNNLKQEFNIFSQNLQNYNPRKFVIENLTSKCVINMIKKFFNII
jgi:glycosyltransferase involved in cell wall biosynthesis